ncbi:PP2C family protein-serine/threonine phosphatase [Streptomyces sp. NPDC006879]|uniref:PP2C family protein-serine/threonine phosphatase n=1 Tax=Streptomyces sp. NPDC006879 TaxID=3364767 RepID=UPI0036AE062B
MGRSGETPEGEHRADARGHAQLHAWQTLLEEAVEAIGTTLDEQTTCRELTAFLCPRWCDAIAVELVAGRQGGDPEGAEQGPPYRAAARGRLELLDRCSATGPTQGTDPAAGARATGEGHRRWASTGIAGGLPWAALSAPLTVRGRSYGTVVAVRVGEEFDDEHAATVRFAARLAAAHLGHAHRHAATHSTALNLQQALLAAPGRPHPNLDLATRYLPSGSGVLVGGDWFETVRLHYGRTLLVMGDVMGHGLDAAVDMNAYRSMLRYVAATDLPPHRVLRQLDTAVSQEGSRRPATCLLARLDPARGKAAFASAGHLPPVVFGADGQGELVELPVGPPLGTGMGGYLMTTRELTAAQTLLLFTDGLVERRGKTSTCRWPDLPGSGSPRAYGCRAPWITCWLPWTPCTRRTTSPSSRPGCGLGWNPRRQGCSLRTEAVRLSHPGRGAPAGADHRV